MFHYDESSKVLEISTIPVEHKATVYQVSEMFESYQRYLEHGLIEDLDEWIIKPLNRLATYGSIRKTEDLEHLLEIPRILLDKEKSYVAKDEITYKGYQYYSAFIRLWTQFGGLNKESFCAFKIPYMDRVGVIHREGKDYALISELVQDDDITYSNKELKIVTERGCFINLKAMSKGSVVTYRKKNYNSLEVLLALAKYEELNGEELLKYLRSYEIINSMSEKNQLLALAYAGEGEEKEQLIKAFHSEAYSLTKVRKRINKVLSIERALGCITSRKIVLANKEELQEGTIITSETLKKLYHSRINEIYVVSLPNVTGSILAESVPIFFIRKGSEIIPEIEHLFPDYHGFYADKDIVLESIIMIPENTEITQEILSFLSYNGHYEICIKDREGSSVVKTVPFEREIIGNRHFRCCDIGEGESSEYVYVKENGELVEEQKFLTAYDMLAMISLYDRLIKGKDLHVIASRDLGLRKKVNMAEELFHKAFALAAPEFINIIRKKFLNMYEHDKQFLQDPYDMELLFFILSDKWWSKLYLDLKVVQPIDKTNPIAYYSALSKINTIVKDSNTITEHMRQMSMGHYGRLCPYEIPAGKKLGVVNTRALYCKIVHGVMKTPYY